MEKLQTLLNRRKELSQELMSIHDFLHQAQGNGTTTIRCNDAVLAFTPNDIELEKEILAKIKSYQAKLGKEFFLVNRKVQAMEALLD